MGGAGDCCVGELCRLVGSVATRRGVVCPGQVAGTTAWWNMTKGDGEGGKVACMCVHPSSRSQAMAALALLVHCSAAEGVKSGRGFSCRAARCAHSWSTVLRVVACLQPQGAATIKRVQGGCRPCFVATQQCWAWAAAVAAGCVCAALAAPSKGRNTTMRYTGVPAECCHTQRGQLCSHRHADIASREQGFLLPRPGIYSTLWGCAHPGTGAAAPPLMVAAS